MKRIAYMGAAFVLPMLAFAQTVDSVQSLGSFVIDLINKVAVPLIFALAFVVFIWGVFQFFIAGGHDEEAKDKGKSLMLWGLIGFFIMVSVWGLVHILVGTLNFNPAIPTLPSAPTTR